MAGRYRLPTNIRSVSSWCTIGAPIAPASRQFSAACARHQTAKAKAKTDGEDAGKDEPDSAMSRRLAQMAEDAILEGGPSARRNIEHAGFSEELKKQLEERVAAASFKSENAAAYSIVNMPVCALYTLLSSNH